MPRTVLRTEIVGPFRVIKCFEPGCCWSARLPRRNALATASKLSGAYRKHLEEKHPGAMPRLF